MKPAFILLFLSITAIAGAGWSEETKFPELPFRPVAGWAPLPNGWSMGHGSGVGWTRILKLDRSGKILGSFGKPGKGPGEFYNAHLLNIGKGGEIFVAETQNRRIQKLVPR